MLCPGDVSQQLLVSPSWCNVHRQSSAHSCCEVCPKYTHPVSTSSAVFQDFDEPVQVVSERCTLAVVSFSRREHRKHFGLGSSTEFCTFVSYNRDCSTGPILGQDCRYNPYKYCARVLSTTASFAQLYVFCDDKRTLGQYGDMGERF